MNSEELGKRIKEARLAKKMTQSELVGTFITRNMLSRIESGNACPSVKTLEYLAGRLDLPAGSLISDEVQGEEDPDRNAQQLITVKRLYKESDYTDNSYFGLIAARTEDAENPVYLRIVEAYQSQKTIDIFNNEFAGFFLPAWELDVG